MASYFPQVITLFIVIFISALFGLLGQPGGGGVAGCCEIKSKSRIEIKSKIEKERDGETCGRRFRRGQETRAERRWQAHGPAPSGSCSTRTQVLQGLTLMPRKLLLFVAVPCLLTSLVSAAEQQPNFVIFIADDMAWDDCGAYGHPSIRTPNIELRWQAKECDLIVRILPVRRAVPVAVRS